jgi:hypothetical protein
VSIGHLLSIVWSLSKESRFGRLCQNLNYAHPSLNLDVIPLKTCRYTPGEKLLTAFLLILAGYPSLYLLNTTLRPDPVLAQAWGQEQLPEQSIVSRTLDACNEIALAELRSISWKFWHRHSRLPEHDWRKRLILDLDLTPLPASPRAEASTRGYMGKKTRAGVS